MKSPEGGILFLGSLGHFLDENCLYKIVKTATVLHWRVCAFWTSDVHNRTIGADLVIEIAPKEGSGSMSQRASGHPLSSQREASRLPRTAPITPNDDPQLPTKDPQIPYEDQPPDRDRRHRLIALSWRVSSPAFAKKILGRNGICSLAEVVYLLEENMMPSFVCRSVLALLLGSFSFSCGGGAGPFAGSFSGNYQSTISYTSPTPSTMPMAATSILSITDSSVSDMVVDFSQSLGSGCLINATRNGNSATLAVGQSCTNATGGVTTILTIKNGTVSINDAALTVNAGGDVSGSSGGGAFVGTFVYTFTGSKR